MSWERNQWQYEIHKDMDDEEVNRSRRVEARTITKHFMQFCLGTLGVRHRENIATPRSDLPSPEAALEQPALAWFEERWRKKRPFGDTTWRELRGPYGETVLHMFQHVKKQAGKSAQLKALVTNTMREMLDQAPELASVAHDQEPWKGMTILHVACATGDLELVQMLTDPKVLQHLDVNQRMSGSFGSVVTGMSDTLHGIREKATPGCEAGCMALELALGACPEPPKGGHDVIVDIVSLVVKAGAHTVITEDGTPDGKVLYTLLHFLARGRWPTLASLTHTQHISTARTTLVIDLFMKPGSELYWNVDPHVRNFHNLTALHVAAMFGNEACFVGMLDRMKVESWHWGSQREAGFPLHELDCAASDEEISALELMTVYKRGNLLRLGIMGAIIEEKWLRFGRVWLMRSVTFQLLVAFLSAVVCLDDTVGYNSTRYYARIAVVVLSGSFISFNVFIYVTCARSEPFFKEMAWTPWNKHRKLDVGALLVLRNFVEVIIMCALAVTAPWHNPLLHASTIDGTLIPPEVAGVSTTFSFWWHCCASLWWLLCMHFSLRYFELFETTGHLASALPMIIRHDIVPFSLIYLVIFLACATSLRISATGSHVPGADDTVGSFLKTVMTLEESIHGPETRWRNVVEDHPVLTAMIFVGFLWLTLVSVTILTAMFTARYDGLKENVREIYLFRRATWTITQEKLFPQWYHKWGSFEIGATLGGEGLMDEVHDDETGRGMVVVTTAREGFVKAGKQRRTVVQAPRPTDRSSQFQPAMVDERTPLALPDSERLERWFLWRGHRDNFDRWKNAMRCKEQVQSL